jgi:hypothetical protein
MEEIGKRRSAPRRTWATVRSRSKFSSEARTDVFAALLVETDVVRAMLAAHLSLRNSLGPHGISLLVHPAKRGEQAVREVSELLQEAAATV